MFLNGYSRWYDTNTASFKQTHPKAKLIIKGPGSQEWIFSIKANNSHDLQQVFEDKKSPTGTYYAYYYVNNKRCGSVSFKKEAYKVPKFEVNLHGDELVALDKPFDVQAIAQYYAGGQLIDQLVSWRVTQVPYTWTPKTNQFKAFSFSSDSRFSGRSAFRSSSSISKSAKTDSTGSAKLTIDPTIEVSLNPRSYVVEATVTDIDLQRVTNTKKFNAVPPLVLGLKVDRYFEKSGDYNAQLIVLDFEGQLIAGQNMSVRLIKRVWQSHLQATDFSNGEAKYKTQVSETVIYEQSIVSEEKIIDLPISLNQSGVYVLEIQTQDELGRMQEISMDFFVDGSQAVTWSKPPSDVFTVTSDKNQYNPGDTATLILESPFQNAMAMAVVEKPNGFDYQLIEIINGKASFELKIEQRFMPKLPVHFLLWRGRLGNFNIQARLDLGKPTTVASTKWLSVAPIANQINVTLKHDKQKQPGEELEIEINLKNYKNKSIPGKVTLWLVDQAVLSLGNEQKLNIIDDFIVYRGSRLSITDTRNLGFGYVPLDTKVGGGLAMSKKEQKALIDNVTVRKNFKDVPFYEVITIDDSGKAIVKVILPDNLTKFKIRVKVESGDELFGYAKSQVDVQLPVLVQPALPRFLRLGDSFVAMAIARVIDNTSGDAIVDFKVNNILIKNKDELIIQQSKDFVLHKQTPIALTFDAKVPLQLNLEKINTADIQVAVVRLKDKTSDAFKVSLPILTDQNLIRDTQQFTVKAGQSLVVDALDFELRDNTFNAKLIITNDKRFLSLQSALSYLIQYPHGCTEQRISKAQSLLSYKQFEWLNIQDSSAAPDKLINQTLDWIKSAKHSNGHIGFWPGSHGYVFLSAISLRFIHQAQQAGYYVDEAFKRQLVDMLKRSLRKDYSGFIVGEQYTERTMALLALKKIGQLDDSYVAELMRNAQFLNTHSRAMLLQVLTAQQASLDSSIEQSLWDDMVFKLYQNNEIWAGFQSNSFSSRSILPSDTQTLAASLQAFININPNHPRVKLLLDGLFELSDENGWGSTRANASALDSLFEWINQGDMQGNEFPISLTIDNKKSVVKIIKMNVIDIINNNPITLTNKNDFDVTINVVRSYMPKESGSKATNINNGFVIERNWINVSKANLKIPIDLSNQVLNIKLGDVIEEHVQVINQSKKVQVAIKIPLPAGVEPLNPELNISNSDAITTGKLTLSPSYTQYLDDSVTYYYDTLAKGNYDFYFRVRATTQGEFNMPPANIQMMYDDKVWGQSFGAKVIIDAVDSQ